eukprot:gene7867-10676_t
MSVTGSQITANSSFSDAFITEIDSTIPLRDTNRLPNERLDPVRKEHKKIMEIVDAFNSKVEMLVERQRNEYVLAYENHMQDVQKELYSLREKVAEIANDDTKNEKMKQLKRDQEHFKSETMSLEVKIEELRKKMRIQVEATYSAEKSRDWLLKKLREAKKKYKQLIKERKKILEDMDSIGSIGNDSLSHYTLDIIDPNNNNNNPKSQSSARSNQKAKWQNDLNHNYGVNRTNPLPSIKKKSESNNNFPATDNHNPWIAIINSSPVKRNLDSEGNQIMKSDYYPVYSPKSNNSYSYNNEVENNQRNESIKDKLITIRTRHHDITKMLTYCSNSCNKRPWIRVNKRPLEELLKACEKELSKNDPGNFEKSSRALQLACELAAIPETYSIMLELLNFEGRGPIDPSSPDRNMRLSGSSSKHAMNRAAAEHHITNYNHDQPYLEYSQSLDLQYLDSKSNDGNDLFPPALSMSTGLDNDLHLVRAKSPPLISNKPLSSKKLRELNEFQRRLDEILKMSDNKINSVKYNSDDHTISGDIDSAMSSSTLLDDDLWKYLKKQKKSKKLKELGYFEKDNFLQFD